MIGVDKGHFAGALWSLEVTRASELPCWDRREEAALWSTEGYRLSLAAAAYSQQTKAVYYSENHKQGTWSQSAFIH